MATRKPSPANQRMQAFKDNVDNPATNVLGPLLQEKSLKKLERAGSAVPDLTRMGGNLRSKELTTSTTESDSTSVNNAELKSSVNPTHGWNKGVSHEGTTYYTYHNKKGDLTSLKTRKDGGGSSTIHNDPSGTYNKVLTNIKYDADKKRAIELKSNK